jgi:hypothetical protein
MAYVSPNYKTKKDFIAAVKAGVKHKTYNQSVRRPMMTHTNEFYPTTNQERQMIACAPFNEHATGRDLMPDQIVDESWFANTEPTEAELAGVCWFEYLHSQEVQA